MCGATGVRLESVRAIMARFVSNFKPMSHLYVISPSSAVHRKTEFKRGIRYLEQLGHQVEVDAAALTKEQRFAGSDEVRLEAIARAANSGADMVLTSRGGYGLSRILPRLPYKAIARSVQKGTQWAGFSDFTALSMAVMAKTGTPTWAGPAVIEDFGADAGVDDITQACWEDILFGMAEGTGWRIGKSDPTEWMVTDAMLWGGNLTLLSSLVGTPYLPHVERGILFLEDVGEAPYRVERMLTQLLHAGVLARQKAIVLGAFTGQRQLPTDGGHTMRSVVAWLREHTKAKVLTGLPMGHVRTKVMLPIGKPVDLAVQGREALLMWAHDHD
ncbi:MAG: hypothetical protein RL357_553 [Pseudomonadota bacterium]|jgi:muramoyltetrapeptide carboxypeptidase